MSTDEETTSRDFNLDIALRQALRHGSANISTHLIELQRDVVVGNSRTRLHCYFLPLDGNGRVRFKPLAEFLRNQIIDYAIPRSTIQEAINEQVRSGSMTLSSKLHERARSLFTHLANTGEGGELLLFAMAEAIFGLTQVICKMTLKTSTSMHYHGSDGVYAEAREDGGLNIYWGESKIYSDATSAIRNCLESLGPFLREPEGEDAERNQDILLINEFANFNDERLVNALKQFLDTDNPASLKLKHCGIALTAFDCSAYPAEGVEVTADRIAAAISNEITVWVEATNRRISHEKLELFDMHFICVPIPSADIFRQYFLELLGMTHES